MRETKLILLLSRFKNTELKAFDKFVQSPYFNTNETIINLWNYIKKYAPKFDASQLNQERIFKKLFPKETFNEKKLRQLRSRLFKLVTEFLTMEQFKADTQLKKKKLATAYYEKDFYDWFEDDSRKLIQVINAKPIQYEGDYLALTQLHQELFFNQRSIKHIPSPPDLLQCSEQLEHFYWLSKLKYACEWVGRVFINKDPIPESAKNIELPKKYLEGSFPLFHLYFNIYQIYRSSFSDSEAYFQQTIQLFHEQLEHLPLKEQISILMYLLNFGIVGIRVDEIKYNPIVFSLYKLGLTSKALIWKEQLADGNFINIVYLGCKLEEIEWVQQFIANYQAYLNLPVRQQTVTYALAIVSFFEKKFEEAFFKLENLKFNDLNDELARKGLQIRSGFECFRIKNNFYDLLLSKCENFRKFLNRKAYINLGKKGAMNSFNETIKHIAILIYTVAPKQEFVKIKMEIEQQQVFLAKDWFLKHLNQIIIDS